MLPPRHVWCFANTLRRGILGGLLTIVLLAEGAFGSPPGAVISNQASLDYLNLAGQPTTILSNEVNVVTAVVRSPASIEFTRVVAGGTGTYQESVGPASCNQGGAFVPLADPILIGGNSIDPTVAHDVSATSAYNTGEAAFIRLIDSDQNVDYQVIDYATVTVSNTVSGDAETVRLTETGLNTGIFAGYVPLGSGAPLPGDCVLRGAANTIISVNYADPADPGDTCLLYTSDAADDSALV